MRRQPEALRWPDLPAALTDAHGVLRRGGSLLLTWHSMTAPDLIRRKLAQPESWWTTVLDWVPDEFGNAHRHDLRYTTVCGLPSRWVQVWYRRTCSSRSAEERYIEGYSPYQRCRPWASTSTKLCPGSPACMPLPRVP